MDYRNRRSTAFCLVGVFLLLELVPLLIPKPFYVDWVNHVWILEYYTQYLREHWTFPETINVEQSFGNPMPLFYGILFYSLLAFLSLVTGADMALRLCFGFLLIVPVFTFFMLYRALIKNTVLVIYLSILTNFSIYQLTNLYSRAALTEFFAYQLMIIGVSLSYYAILNIKKSSNALLALGCVSFLFALGSHPVTLYTFCIFVFPIIVIFVFYYRFLFKNFSFGKIMFGGCLAGALLLPWLLNAALFQSELRIANSRLYYFPQSIDSLLAKIGLFYIDQRVNEDGLFATATPFLNARLPLMLFACVCFFCYYAYSSTRIDLKKGFIFAGLILLILIIGIIPPVTGSAGPWPGSVYVSEEHGLLYRLLMPIQFGYRLSGTISLCLVVMAVFSVHFFALANAHEVFIQKLNNIIYLACFLAVISHAQKLGEIYFEYFKGPQLLAASSVEIPDENIDARVLMLDPQDYQSISKNINRYPFTFYGERAYTMPHLYVLRPETDQRDVQRMPMLVREYGQEIAVTCERACILQTNIVPTSLHRVLIDGRKPEKAFLDKTENLEFDLSAGSHVLRVDLVGDYVKPIIVSIWLALGLLCLVVVYALMVVGSGIRAKYDSFLP